MITLKCKKYLEDTEVYELSGRFSAYRPNKGGWLFSEVSTTLTSGDIVYITDPDIVTELEANMHGVFNKLEFTTHQHTEAWEFLLVEPGE